MERERDLSGLEVEGYRLERLLSRNAFTAIYAAEQLSIARPVVVKLLRSALARRPAAVETFLTIAQRTASLDHPNVVSVLDVRETDARSNGERFVFYVMERVEGGSLAERVTAEGSLSAMEATRLLVEIARVLELSAERGLVHSAIEPAHVLFASDGRSKLLHVGAGDRTARRVKEAARGPGSSPDGRDTLSFCAPEQIAAGRADRLCDLYALGACVRYALVGEPIHDEGDAEGLLSAHRASAAPTVASASDEPLPAWLASTVDSLVARRRARRPASATALLDSLPPDLVRRIVPDRTRRSDRVDRGEPRSAEIAPDTDRPDDDPPAPGSPRRPSSARWFTSVPVRLALASVLASVAFVLFLLTRHAPDTPPSPGEPPDDERQIASGSSAPTAAVDETGREQDDDSRAAVPRDTSASRDRSSPPARERGSDASSLNSRTPAGDEARAPDRARDIASPDGTPSGGEPTTASPAPQRRRYSAEERHRMADEYAREVDPEVDAGRWPLAWERVLALVERYPDYDPLERRRDEIARRIETDWKRETARLRKLAPDASVETLARERESLVARFPTSHAEPIDALFEEIAAENERSASDRARLHALATELRRALLDGRADAARAALRDVEAASPLSFGDALRTAIERAEKGRIALAEGLRAAIGRPELKVRSREKAWRTSAGEGVIVRATGSSLATTSVVLPVAGTAADPGAETGEVELLELEDTSLVAIARLGREDSPTTAELATEVGSYLALVRGAARGRGLLLAHVEPGPESSGAPPEEVAWIEPLAASQLAAGLEFAISTLESLDRENAKAASWAALARGFAPFVLDHANDATFESERERVETVYRRARREAVLRDGVEGRFRGKSRLTSGGMLTLTWDFDSKQELEDFRVVSGDLTIEGGELIVNGEIRLGHGDLLRERAEISAAFTEYDPRAPNLNLALWTRDDDRLVPDRRDRLRSNDPRPEIAGSYLVFGLGYAPTKSTRATSYSDRVVLVGSREVALPVFAVVVADRTRALDADVECVWAESTLHRVRGPQTVRLDVRPDGFSWLANRESLHMRPGRARKLVAGRVTHHAAIGSLSIATFDSSVRLASLRLEARLNESWLDSEATRIANEELEALAPRPRPEPTRGAGGSRSRRGTQD